MTTLHHHDGQRDGAAVGEREGDAGDPEFAGAAGSAAGEDEGGPAAGFARDFEFEPADAI
jgi:hypothetical protein